MTTTAYLDLFLRTVTEPALLHTFLRFILLHRHDNVHILDTLVSRINTPFQVLAYNYRGSERVRNTLTSKIPQVRENKFLILNVVYLGDYYVKFCYLTKRALPK